MSTPGSAPDASPYVSSGELPPAESVAALVAEAHERFASNTEGRRSDVYPVLAAADESLFGLCVVATDGTVHAAGDTDVAFSVMSVSKPFVFALVCEAIGPDEARARIGVNSTGRAFNSVAAVEAGGDGRTNPIVNPGAIVTTSLVPGRDADDTWQAIVDGLSRFAGRTLTVDEEVYASATATNQRNRSISWLLESYGRLALDPAVALDLYTRQCSLDVTARDLAVMGATLADGGMNPITGEQVVAPMVCHYTLAVMATAGMYETSGDWLYDVGLPGKSGISGGIVTVSPGKGAMGTFAPPLDEVGNSVKGQLASRFLSQRLGMDLFVSRPAPRAR